MQIRRQIVLMETLLKKKAHELESKEVVTKMTFIYNYRKALVILLLYLEAWFRCVGQAEVENSLS